ncbi:MAG TPA: carbonic anhydrase [Chitinophagaceae bacterium]|nr:carbonic anhydrase [Chitinophagaceae bacterium]HRG25473.1 carbonic anhydrase [Chitinophagaceae bacterium]
MKPYEVLLHDNKHWAARKKAEDPAFFERLLHVQSPEFLWIGCSDSRVPPDQITQTEPGEIFIHRNVANLVVNTDVNLMSVVDYAVNHLKIKHVVVCGHYGCGGIKAAMSNTDFNQVLNMWLRNIKDIYRIHRKELEAITDEESRVNRMVEINVKEQIFNLAKTAMIQRAWSNDQRPDLHGWVYDLHDGLIKPVIEMKAGSDVDELYEFEGL